MVTEVAFSEFPGYKEFLLDDGTKVYHDCKSGEDVPSELRHVPSGSVILTPRKLASQKKYREQQEYLERQKVERSEQRKQLGAYIFAASDNEAFSDLPADMMARAVYLAAHLDFESDILWATQRTPVKRSELHKVLRLSESAADTFWRNVKDKYFYRDKDGCLHAKKQVFTMGHLAALPSTEYQKVYTRALRELYEKIPVRQHKRLGYALKMLPYLNFEFNVLCHDPTVTAYDEIQPLTAAEFCEKVGFDKTHVSQLAADYGRLTFTVDGMQEIFCKFLSNGRDMATAHVYVNPRLIYKGTDFRKVETIGISFATDAKPV